MNTLTQEIGDEKEQIKGIDKENLHYNEQINEKQKQLKDVQNKIEELRKEVEMK